MSQNMKPHHMRFSLIIIIILNQLIFFYFTMNCDCHLISKHLIYFVLYNVCIYIFNVHTFLCYVKLFSNNEKGKNAGSVLDKYLFYFVSKK